MWPHSWWGTFWIACHISWLSSPVSADVSSLPPWCQISVLLWRCCMLRCHLTKRQIEPTHFSSFHPSLLFGGYRTVSVITSSTHFQWRHILRCSFDSVHRCRMDKIKTFSNTRPPVAVFKIPPQSRIKSSVTQQIFTISLDSLSRFAGLLHRVA